MMSEPETPENSAPSAEEAEEALRLELKHKNLVSYYGAKEGKWEAKNVDDQALIDSEKVARRGIIKEKVKKLPKDAGKQQEEAWRRRRKKRATQWAYWTFGAVVGVIIVVMGLALWPYLNEKARLKRLSEVGQGHEMIERDRGMITDLHQNHENRLVENMPLSEDAKKLRDDMEKLSRKLPEAKKRAKEICELLGNQPTLEQILENVRQGTNPELVSAWMQATTAEQMPDPKAFFFTVTSSGNLPAIQVMGRRKDYTYYVTYLVEENGRFVLDWDSFNAYSEISLEDLEHKEVVGSFMVRALISDTNFYTPPKISESLFAAYLIRGLDASVYVWGYVERGSSTDLQMRQVLQREFSASNTDSEFKKNENQLKAVMLRIKPAEGAVIKKQFEIVEVLRDNWLEPVINQKEKITQ